MDVDKVDLARISVKLDRHDAGSVTCGTDRVFTETYNKWIGCVDSARCGYIVALHSVTLHFFQLCTPCSNYFVCATQ